MPKISVIIPVYGVAKYIKRCSISLFEQTLDSVEFIFVDDASTDNSIDILNECIVRYPWRSESVHVIRHECNKGLPAARNTGLAYATGDYIFHCDGDDYVEPRMLELMYDAAISKEADMVWCDWFLSYENGERYMTQPSFSSGIDAMKGMLDGRMKYNVWNKLVKRSVYVDHSIVFPSGYSMGEDMTMICLASHCRIVCNLNQPFYHYVKTNGDAMTTTMTASQQESLLYNTNRTIEYLQREGFTGIDREIACFKLNVKLPLIISDNTDYYELWSKWFPEANKYIWENTGNSLRIRFVEYLASKRFFIVVRLYYLLVYKLIYRLLYRC